MQNPGGRPVFLLGTKGCLVSVVWVGSWSRGLAARQGVADLAEVVGQEAIYFRDRPVVIVEEIKRDAPVLLASLNPHMPPRLRRTYVLGSVHDPGPGTSI